MNDKPWLLEGAICFLDNYLKQLSNPYILEFGTGGSTIWFANRTTNLVSVDHDPTWHNNVKEKLKEINKKAELLLLDRPYNYICEEYQYNYFDLILIDGRDRVKCIKSCINILKPNGILMLDNSERPQYAEGIDLLKSWPSQELSWDGPNSWSTRWWQKI